MSFHQPFPPYPQACSPIKPLDLFLQREQWFYHEIRERNPSSFLEILRYAQQDLEFRNLIAKGSVLPVKLNHNGYTHTPLGTLLDDLTHASRNPALSQVIDLYEWPTVTQIRHTRRPPAQINPVDPAQLYWAAELVAELQAKLRPSKAVKHTDSRSEGISLLVSSAGRWIKACVDSGSLYLGWHDIQLIDYSDIRGSGKRWGKFLSSFEQWAKEKHFQCLCLWHRELHGLDLFKYSMQLLTPHIEVARNRLTPVLQELRSTSFQTNSVGLCNEREIHASGPIIHALKGHFSAVKQVHELLRPKLSAKNKEPDRGRLEIK